MHHEQVGAGCQHIYSAEDPEHAPHYGFLEAELALD